MAGAETFYVPTREIGQIEGARIGVGWLAKLVHAGVPGEPVVLAHAKSMAHNNEHMAIAAATFGWESFATWRRSSWNGGPVLALYAGAKDLTGILERSYLITHLCVVESTGDPPAAWLQAARPRYLVGAPETRPALDPVVVGALLSLTAFVNRAHYANTEDVALGIRTCQQLQGLGYGLDPVAFEAFALENRWDPDAAARFGETVAKVADGHQFRNRELRHWPTRATVKTREFWRTEGARYLANPAAARAEDDGI